MAYISYYLSPTEATASTSMDLLRVCQDLQSLKGYPIMAPGRPATGRLGDLPILLQSTNTSRVNAFNQSQYVDS